MGKKLIGNARLCDKAVSLNVRSHFHYTVLAMRTLQEYKKEAALLFGWTFQYTTSRADRRKVGKLMSPHSKKVQIIIRNTGSRVIIKELPSLRRRRNWHYLAS